MASSVCARENVSKQVPKILSHCAQRAFVLMRESGHLQEWQLSQGPATQWCGKPLKLGLSCIQTLKIPCFFLLLSFAKCSLPGLHCSVLTLTRFKEQFETHPLCLHIPVHSEFFLHVAITTEMFFKFGIFCKVGEYVMSWALHLVVKCELDSMFLFSHLDNGIKRQQLKRRKVVVGRAQGRKG